MNRSIRVFFAVVCSLGLFAIPAGAGEASDVGKELYPLRREVKKLLGQTNRFKNPEWKEANMASIRAKGAVGRLIDEHPDLENLRRELADAKKAYDEVRNRDDKELTIKRRRAMQDIDGELHREGFKLQEVKEAQAASIAARRKVEAIEYAMIAELNDEAKAKVAKVIELEKRQRELLAAEKEKK